MNTAWTDKVDLNMPLPEYPRPQLARRLWLNLNGPWEYAITTSARHPKEFEGQIIVPFSPESELSGVNRSLKAGITSGIGATSRCRRSLRASASF